MTTNPDPNQSQPAPDEFLNLIDELSPDKWQETVSTGWVKGVGLLMIMSLPDHSGVSIGYPGQSAVVIPKQDMHELAKLLLEAEP